MNYPVTTPFGQVAGYPLNNGFHNGIDYGYPMGTPVVVNGVTIGLSNNTGATTGPHLHVGKYVNGTVQDPGVGNGFNFNSAVVYDIGSDASDGNFVRITGDGALWNYLHLEKILVTKGQVLKGVSDVMDENDVTELYKTMVHRDPENAEVVREWTGHKPAELATAIRGSQEWLTQNHKLTYYDQNDKLIHTLQDQVQALQAGATGVSKAAVKEIADNLEKLAQ